jgi:hypothetical protein
VRSPPASTRQTGHGQSLRPLESAESEVYLGGPIYGAILEAEGGIPRSSNQLSTGSPTRMPSESLHDTPPPEDLLNAMERSCADDSSEGDPAKIPVDLSQFSQRLASFGLGESPDPLLTESRPPGKRRPRR